MLFALTFAGVLYAAIILSRCSPALRIVLGAYLGIYFVTSVVGGLVLRYPGALIDALNIYFEATGADTKYFDIVHSPAYALGLASPFFVASTTAFAVSKVNWLSQPWVISRERSPTLLLLAFWFALVAHLSWCVFMLYRAGLLEQLFEVETIWSGYRELISTRELAFSKLGAAFFGVVYVGLPALSFVAMAAWIEERSSSWSLALAITVLSSGILLIGTGQKAPLFAHWLVLGLAYYTYAVGRKWLVPLVLVSVLFLGVTMSQLLIRDTWELLDTLLHLLLRMGFATPYYFYVFPALEPFTGIDALNDITGLGGTRYMQIPLIVFSHAFPSVPNMTGFAPAPAHISAYAEGGLTYMFFVEVLIGIWIAAVSALLFRARAWLGRAAAITGLLGIYYLTQVSIRLTLLGSYGLIWGVASLSVVVVGYLALRQFSRSSNVVLVR